MILPFPHAWASSPERFAIALAVTVSFAAIARALRGVNRSGMFAGGLACFLLFAGNGPAAFGVLTTLFVLTWASTLLGHQRKLELGLAERGDGRNARQVLANLAVAAIASLAFTANGKAVWPLILVSALSEAATDTVASEVGQSRSRTSILISSGKQVPAGTDGGITPVGTVAGAAAGVVIAATSALGGLILSRQLWIPATAGFAGMLLDSILGATVQRRGWLSNEMVNLLATLAAAAIVLLVAGR